MDKFVFSGEINKALTTSCKLYKTSCKLRVFATNGVLYHAPHNRTL